MPGDYSRRTFDPAKDRVGVFQQQGRVVVDADFNEQVEIFDRRLRATTLDTLGKAVVPRETPDGFKITLGSGGAITIGPGRAYVDGILVDNHGGGTLAFDPRLEERRGSNPIPYTAQPYVKPAPAGPPTTGTYLAYLDVWHRERTWVEERTLLDPALNGVDTGTRRQTVWQVKWVNAPAGTTCTTPDASIPEWVAATAPAVSRLTTTTVAVPAADEPCEIPPSGGYRGPENRLYRVEVHDGGASPTFKWSRDNASIGSPVLAITGQRLRVARTGRDKVLRFRKDDWVEITDERLELSGQPGEMAQVLLVDEARDIVELTAPLAGAFDANDATRATRIRRWDQRTLLDAAASPLPTTGAQKGVVPITATNTGFTLEDGVRVTFSPTPAAGVFRSGEYWIFAARAADGSVEVLDAAPPIGPHHHYARLAVVTPASSTVADCRTLWPPDQVTVEGGDCECTACVSAESHNSGQFTIQQAVNEVAPTGGTVCLGPGVYRLAQSVIIASNAVRIRGKGLATVITTPGSHPAFRIESAIGTTIEDLAITGRQYETGTNLRDLLSADTGGEIAILLESAVSSTIQRCAIAMDLDVPERAAAVAMAGIVHGTTVRDSVVRGGVGIGTLEDKALLLSDTRITDNLLTVERRGVNFAGTVVFGLANRIEANLLRDAREIAIALEGRPLNRSGSVMVRGNVISVTTVGVFSTVTGSAIDDNVFSGAGKEGGLQPGDRGLLANRLSGSARGGPPPARGASSGVAAAILLVAGDHDDEGLTDCRITGNSIADVLTVGILAQGRLADLVVSDNVVDGALEAGVFVEGRHGSATVSDNLVRNIVGEKFAIGIGGIGLELFVVRDNGIEGSDGVAPEVRGVSVEESRTSVVDGNTIRLMGEPDSSGAAGIRVVGDFTKVDVSDNLIEQLTKDGGTVGGRWLGVQIDGRKPDVIGEPGDPDDVKRDYSLPAGRPVVGIRGNYVEGSGMGPIVDVVAPGSVTFSDNRAIFRPSEDSFPAVRAECTAAVVSGNYVETGKKALAIQVDAHPSLCTALGNVANNHISIRGSLLPPWDRMNVIAP